MALLPYLRYLTFADVNSRLNNTVVRYQGHPVYVDQNGPDDDNDNNRLTVHLRDVINRRWIPNVHSSDDELDVSAFPIGYAKYRNMYRYFTRIPTRHNVGGLNSRNLCYWQRDPAGNYGPQNPGRDVLLNVDFHAALADNFPTLQQALDQVRQVEGHTVAFGRKLAVFNDDVGLIKLAYFGRPVAVWNERYSVFKVSERLEKYIPIIKSFGVDNCEAA